MKAKLLKKIRKEFKISIVTDVDSKTNSLVREVYSEVFKGGRFYIVEYSSLSNPACCVTLQNAKDKVLELVLKKYKIKIKGRTEKVEKVWYKI